jgi:hypothetical protein
MSLSPTPPEGSSAVAAGNDALDQVLSSVELHLAALGDAMLGRDAEAIDRCAVSLHRSLAIAIDCFSDAARRGRIPEPLRQRLAAASGQVAAQRESLARATAALDRAIDVLIPRDLSPAAYGAAGRRDRPSLGSAIA